MCVKTSNVLVASVYQVGVLRQVFLDDKIVYDKVLSLHGVLPHVVFEKLLHLVVLVKRHLFETYVWTDEIHRAISHQGP